MMFKHTIALLQQIAHGIAVRFNNNYAVLVHDLTTDYTNSSIVIMETGNVTIRKIDVEADGHQRCPSNTVYKFRQAATP